MAKKKRVKRAGRPRKVTGKKKAAKKSRPKKAAKKSPKKSAKKKTAAKKPPKKASGKVVLGKSSDAPGQQPLPGMAEEKIQTVETCIAKIVKLDAEISEKKDERDTHVSKLPGLFKRHKLQQYSHAGRKVTSEPGEEAVKIKKIRKTADK